MSAKPEVYTIELHRPAGVSVGELVAYIREAVEDWGGQKHPEDPLFYPWRSYRGSKSPHPPIRVRRVSPSVLPSTLDMVLRPKRR